MKANHTQPKLVIKLNLRIAEELDHDLHEVDAKVGIAPAEVMRIAAREWIDSKGRKLIAAADALHRGVEVSA